MRKSKVSDEDIVTICTRYVHNNESMEILSKEYGLAPSTLFRKIDRAIFDEILSTDIIDKLKQKYFIYTLEQLRD